MNLFSFRDSVNPKPASDDSQSAASIPSTEGNIAAVDAKASALAAAPTSRKSRKRQSETGADSGGIAAASPSPELRAEIAKQLEASFDPKAWGALLALPANAALALTGHKHWDVSKEERDTMGTCGSIAARYLMVENPKTLALLMLSSAMFSVYVPRLQQEFKLRREKKATDQPTEKI